MLQINMADVGERRWFVVPYLVLSACRWWLAIIITLPSTRRWSRTWARKLIRSEWDRRPGGHRRAILAMLLVRSAVDAAQQRDLLTKHV